MVLKVVKDDGSGSDCNIWKKNKVLFLYRCYTFYVLSLTVYWYKIIFDVLQTCLAQHCKITEKFLSINHETEMSVDVVLSSFSETEANVYGIKVVWTGNKWIEDQMIVSESSLTKK